MKENNNINNIPSPLLRGKDVLTEKEKHRYSRHILLSKVGLQGQQKLKVAKVLVIGVGGLGCPVLQYLTAAGVGTIGIIDFDIVDETNLQRQILFNMEDVGKSKVEQAFNHLTKQNPFVKFRIFNEKLTPKNALNLFTQFDIIVDGTDNFATRYLVNDACVITAKPLVYGAIFKFEGQVAVFNYNNGPTYRCLFPDPPKDGSVPNCSDVGVIGVLPGIIGTQQANEVIKLILEIGTSLSGKLLTYNSLNNSFLTLNITRSEVQVARVLTDKVNFENKDYDFFCGIKSKKNSNEISIEKLKEMYRNDTDFQLVDVRESWEQPRVKKENVLVATLEHLDDFVSEISKNKKVVVICQHGIRSVAAIEQLSNQYDFNNLINLKNGISNWE